MARPPGFLLIQIDGLSRRQLERALANGRMPLLAARIDRGGLVLHTLYSGLPSSTPAVQGELFYGVKGAVPAFGFRDPVSERPVTMLDPEVARRVEAGLAIEGEPLLAGGSAYCDIYTGGAAESHFCPATLVPGGLLPAVGQLAPEVAAGHARAVAAMAVAVASELGHGIVECARGIWNGEDPPAELKFVPTRAAMVGLLREACIAGARMDLERGLPIVHVNLPGFDEQAHRRGPGSEFAHAALPAIDHAIESLWEAARAAPGRSYEVFLYSDHGQEETVRYAPGELATLEAAVATVAGAGCQVIAKGPLGFVYADGGMTQAERDRSAELLAIAGVPLVLFRDGAGGAAAWTPRGRFSLPQDAAAVLGRDHPFLADAAGDLTALCCHPLAGDLVVSGFVREGPQLTFPEESGSHAGPGPEETRAFALLPARIPLDVQRGYLRPLDLRSAVLAGLPFAARADGKPADAPGRWSAMEKLLWRFSVLVLGLAVLLSLPEPERSIIAIGLFLGSLILLALGRAEPSWRERLY